MSVPSTAPLALKVVPFEQCDEEHLRQLIKVVLHHHSLVRHSAFFYCATAKERMNFMEKMTTVSDHVVALLQGKAYRTCAVFFDGKRVAKKHQRTWLMLFHKAVHESRLDTALKARFLEEITHVCSNVFRSY